MAAICILSLASTYEYMWKFKIDAFFFSWKAVKWKLFVCFTFTAQKPELISPRILYQCVWIVWEILSIVVSNEVKSNEMDKIRITMESHLCVMLAMLHLTKSTFDVSMIFVYHRRLYYWQCSNKYKCVSLFVALFVSLLFFASLLRFLCEFHPPLRRWTWTSFVKK